MKETFNPDAPLSEKNNPFRWNLMTGELKRQSTEERAEEDNHERGYEEKIGPCKK